MKTKSHISRRSRRNTRRPTRVSRRNAVSAADLRRRVRQQIAALPPERLGVVADFIGYLSDRGADRATDELLQVPGLRRALDAAERDVKAGRVKNWRAVRGDV